MEPIIEIPTEEAVSNAIAGIANLDKYLWLPNTESLGAIKGIGLEEFLPDWYDFETHQTDAEKFEQVLEKSCNADFLPPTNFIDYLRREQQTGISIGEKPFADLEQFLRREVFKEKELGENFSHYCGAWGINYLTIKNVLTVSPEGEVTPTIYMFSSGKVCRDLGIDFFKRQDLASLKMLKDFRLMIYEAIMLQQVQKEYKRFVEILPALEQALEPQLKEHQDLSKMQVVVYIHGVPQGVSTPGGVLL